MKTNNRSTKKISSIELANQQGVSGAIRKTRRLPLVAQQQPVIDMEILTELNTLIERKDNPEDLEVINILRKEMRNIQKEYTNNNPNLIIISKHSDILETSGINMFKEFIKNNASLNSPIPESKNLLNQFISENPNTRFLVQNNPHDITYGFSEMELSNPILMTKVMTLINRTRKK